MRERREYIRLSDSLKIIYRVVTTPPGDAGSISKNIGGGGICFPVKHNLSRGDTLKLEVHLPELAEPIVSTVEVAWVHTKTDIEKDKEFLYVMGVKFIDIDPLDRGKILSYIRESITSGKQQKIEWID